MWAAWTGRLCIDRFSGELTLSAPSALRRRSGNDMRRWRKRCTRNVSSVSSGRRSATRCSNREGCIRLRGDFMRKKRRSAPYPNNRRRLISRALYTVHRLQVWYARSRSRGFETAMALATKKRRVLDRKGRWKLVRADFTYEALRGAPATWKAPRQSQGRGYVANTPTRALLGSGDFRLRNVLK